MRNKQQMLEECGNGNELLNSLECWRVALNRRELDLCLMEGGGEGSRSEAEGSERHLSELYLYKTEVSHVTAFCLVMEVYETILSIK